MQGVEGDPNVKLSSEQHSKVIGDAVGVILAGPLADLVELLRSQQPNARISNVDT